MFRSTIDALGRHVRHKAEVYEQTDARIPQPTRSYLIVVFTLMVVLMMVGAIRWPFNNAYIKFVFELMVFAAFIVVLGFGLFIVLPALYN